MAKTYKPVLVDTYIPPSDVAEARFVGGDGALCGAAAKAIGVSELAATANEASPVIMLGVALIELGGTVAKGAEVESDASGKAVTLSAGKVNGQALEAGVNGDIIRVLVK